MHSDKCDKLRCKRHERDNAIRSRTGVVTSAHKQVLWIRFHLVVARLMASRHARASDSVTTDQLLRRGSMLPSLW
jgi:hypothetical protein